MEQNALSASLNFAGAYNSVRNFTAFGNKINSYNCPSDTPNQPSPAGSILAPQTSYAGVVGLTDIYAFGWGGTLNADRCNTIDSEGVFGKANMSLTVAAITDGTSNTAFVGEQSQFLNEPPGSNFNFNYVGGWFAGPPWGGTGGWPGDARPTGVLSMVPKLNSPANTTGAQAAIGSAGPFGSTQYSFGNTPGFANDPTCTNNLGQWGFRSHHAGGGNFLFGDGSVKFLKNTTNLAAYRATATVSLGEIISADSL